MWIKGKNACLNLNAIVTIRYINRKTAAQTDRETFYICDGNYVDKLLEINKKYSATDILTKKELEKLINED